MFCVDEGFFELPDNSQILNIAGFLTGKYNTGEYFVNSGTITESQLNDAVKNNNNKEPNKNSVRFLLI